MPADTSAASWTPGALENILRETVDLAQIRMVDQDALARTGQLLPAFYIANNVAQATVSTDVTDQPSGAAT